MVLTIKPKVCRMCKGEEFKTVIDFGKSPLVNSLIEEEDLGKPDDVFSLVVEQCQDCSLVQIINIINAKSIYQDQDYLFFSSDMPTLSEYFSDFASDIFGKYMERGDFIVEIGSNDGVFLKNFKGDNVVLGVDPATNVVLRALKKGIPTIPEFFGWNIAKKIEKEYGKVKVIMGANCIAHTEDLHDVMNGVNTLLDDEGVFIVECNYWGGMVKNKNYALIYHDHYSYFTLKNWQDFVKKWNMEVFDAYVTPAQGGSLRVFIARKGRIPLSPKLHELEEEEKRTNLASYSTCQQYEKDIRAKAQKLYKTVTALVYAGKKVAGYGAAAKGFSLLQLAGINEKHIAFFVDDSPAKQGKYTPVSHIKIYPRDEVPFEPDYFFITAPNYAKVIIEKEKDFLAKGGKFILEDSSIVENVIH